MFKLHSKFKPTPPQVEAIRRIVKNIGNGVKDQVLLGVTGCGKTFVMANVIKRTKKPTLIISHNKVLAAQLYQEFKEFFPENAVHYFVSYYDYYQPEAYIPQTDTYIEKDAKINEIIDRLRHEAIQSLAARNDVIIIASVSCIYSIGSPENYGKVSFSLKKGKIIKRKDLLLLLIRLQYQRQEVDFFPGTFRIRGGTIEVFSPTGKEIIKIELSGSRVSRILTNLPQILRKKGRGVEKIEKSFEGLARKNLSSRVKFSSKFTEINECQLFPAKLWISSQDKISLSLKNIKLELQKRLSEFKKQKKFLEAEKLSKKTNYDIEMIKEVGWCHGIENYSRHLEFREPGEPAFTLLDHYLYPVRKNLSEGARDFLVITDESHMTIPQLGAMYEGDRQRKKTLIKYGFRLPSALDNRPLKFQEFEKKVPQVVYVSATPGLYEKSKIRNPRSKKEKKSKKLTEILIRPTGLLDPRIRVKPTKNQVQDLIKEIKKAVEKRERILVTTLTKRLAEDMADYLEEKDIKVNYLHSEIKTLDRPGILKDLRLGKYDVIVGINLLREGLDLPEVALIAILDADKEGFLRNETTLIQTMGRAARHPKGRVIMYADKITGSMKRAIEETERRRKIQERYNKKRNIAPKGIQKEIRDWNFAKEKEEEKDIGKLAKIKDIKILKKEMEKAAAMLDFEKAAKIRDEIKKLSE